jgi:hypothetical protein
VSLNRRDFSKSVGLFSGYLAFGGPKILANEKLIVTPEEYFEEARSGERRSSPGRQGTDPWDSEVRWRSEVAGR